MSSRNPLIPHTYLLLLLLGAGAVACGGDDNLTVPPTTASIEVTTSTTGAELDADGYMVQMDAEPAQAIQSAGSIQYADITPGAHTVQLAGLAPNCTIAGENPRSVDVAAGESATVAFAVTCAATTGGLQVTAATSGPSTDPDGYVLTVDGAERGALTAAGGLSVDGLAPGDHVIGLSGVAANCRVEGDNPRTVTVTTGQSGAVAFAVTCAAPPVNPGTLRIITSSTGPDQDADGYTFAVDGGNSQPIGISATASLANVAAGTHQVRLSGLADNCRLQGDNPRSATVSAGATADVRFTVTCSASRGSLKVSATTTGQSPDADGYTVTVDGGAGRQVDSNGEVNFENLAPGSHSVELGEIESNCQVNGENPRSQNVVAGATAEVSFSVSCSAPSTGPGTWTEVAEIPTFRYSMAEAVVQNAQGQDLFYTMGGEDSVTGAVVQRVEAYNAATGAWTRRADLPEPRLGSTAAVVDNQIYLIGGFDANRSTTTTLHVYDVASDSWSEKGPLPASIGRGIAGVIGGKIYFLSSLSFGSRQQLFRYDPATDRWTRLADPTNDHQNGIGGVIGGKWYVAWGGSYTVDVYDPLTGSWTHKLTQPYAGTPESLCGVDFTDCSVHGAGGAVLQGQLYVIGGGNDDETMSLVYAYDPGANTWTEKAPMHHDRAGPSTGTIRDATGRQRIVAAGGVQKAIGGIKVTEVYTP